jgi:hypothetical protein
MDAAVNAVTSDQVLRDFSKYAKGYIISISESGRTVSEAPGVYNEDRECEPFVQILQ